jgi:hypothetical protein
VARIKGALVTFVDGYEFRPDGAASGEEHEFLTLGLTSNDIGSRAILIIDENGEKPKVLGGNLVRIVNGEVFLLKQLGHVGVFTNGTPVGPIPIQALKAYAELEVDTFVDPRVSAPETT